MKLRLQVAACQRCGRPVTTATYTVAPVAKRKWGILCTHCTTGEERQTINRDIGRELAGVPA